MALEWAWSDLQTGFLKDVGWWEGLLRRWRWWQGAARQAQGMIGSTAYGHVTKRDRSSIDSNPGARCNYRADYIHIRTCHAAYLWHYRENGCGWILTWGYQLSLGFLKLAGWKKLFLAAWYDSAQLDDIELCSFAYDWGLMRFKNASMRFWSWNKQDAINLLGMTKATCFWISVKLVRSKDIHHAGCYYRVSESIHSCSFRELYTKKVDPKKTTKQRKLSFTTELFAAPWKLNHQLKRNNRQITEMEASIFLWRERLIWLKERGHLVCRSRGATLLNQIAGFQIERTPPMPKSMAGIASGTRYETWRTW